MAAMKIRKCCTNKRKNRAAIEIHSPSTGIIPRQHEKRRELKSFSSERNTAHENTPDIRSGKKKERSGFQRDVSTVHLADPITCVNSAFTNDSQVYQKLESVKPLPSTGFNSYSQSATVPPRHWIEKYSDVSLFRRKSVSFRLSTDPTYCITGFGGLVPARVPARTFSI